MYLLSGIISFSCFSWMCIFLYANGMDPVLYIFPIIFFFITLYCFYAEAKKSKNW